MINKGSNQHLCEENVIVNYIYGLRVGVLNSKITLKVCE
jgi:hypothetical protein